MFFLPLLVLLISSCKKKEISPSGNPTIISDIKGSGKLIKNQYGQ